MLQSGDACIGFAGRPSAAAVLGRIVGGGKGTRRRIGKESHLPLYDKARREAGPPRPTRAAGDQSQANGKVHGDERGRNAQRAK